MSLATPLLGIGDEKGAITDEGAGAAGAGMCMSTSLCLCDACCLRYAHVQGGFGDFLCSKRPLFAWNIIHMHTTPMQQQAHSHKRSLQRLRRFFFTSSDRCGAERQKKCVASSRLPCRDLRFSGICRLSIPAEGFFIRQTAFEYIVLCTYSYIQHGL